MMSASLAARHCQSIVVIAQSNESKIHIATCTKSRSYVNNLLMMSQLRAQLQAYNKYHYIAMYSHFEYELRHQNAS
jgi:hypothetical protein